METLRQVQKVASYYSCFWGLSNTFIRQNKGQLVVSFLTFSFPKNFGISPRENFKVRKQVENLITFFFIFFLTKFGKCISLEKNWRILGRRGSRETYRPLPGNFQRSSLTGRPGTPGLRVCSKWLRPFGLSRYAVPKLERVGDASSVCGWAIRMIVQSKF